HFRGKGEHASAILIEQRLLADPVTGEQQPPLAMVPKCEGEHPMQLPYAVCAQLFVEVDYHLGVALGGEGVPISLQAALQVPIVVDLAVEDNAYRSVLVMDRLISGLQVDDPEPLDRDSGTLGRENPARIGAAMVDRLAHRCKRV